VLVRIFTGVVPGGLSFIESRDRFATWLVAWLEEHASPQSKLVADLDAEHARLLAASTAIAGDATRHAAERSEDRTRSLARLANLGPFVAICGDRREPDPQSLADLFILGGAMSDIRWLPTASAGLIREVRSDKLFVARDLEPLRRDFGDANLLIIGGPDVNWAARLVNPHALWRFHVAPDWEQWDRDLRGRLELDHRPTFESFCADIAMLTAPAAGTTAARPASLDDGLAAQILRGPAGTGGRVHSPVEIANLFREGGVTDAAGGVLFQEYSFRRAREFAVVSIAPHPLRDDPAAFSVMVAGVAGPGTAHALRVLLERPGAFLDHPCGGVMEVRPPVERRFDEPGWDWVSPSYTMSELRDEYASKQLNEARALVERLLALSEQPRA
jgi:hypothetical protein